ncbi:hypothetical protein BKA81DRAFT_112178 [Phyllosticta paracitricarpa]
MFFRKKRDEDFIQSTTKRPRTTTLTTAAASSQKKVAVTIPLFFHLLPLLFSIHSLTHSPQHVSPINGWSFFSIVASLLPFFGVPFCFPEGAHNSFWGISTFDSTLLGWPS